MGKKERLVKKLIRKYRDIRATCDEQILERIREAEDYYESFEWYERLMQEKDPDKVIEDMQETSDRTERMICTLEHAVEKYGEIARQEDVASFRQYDALYTRYFSSTFSNVKEIAKKYGVKKSTIYDDLQDAETRLIIILFGPSALREDKSSDEK